MNVCAARPLTGPRARTVATTAELLEWMRLGARHATLVAVSSAAVYGAGHTGPIREEQALAPFSPYGYHKLMMENLCQSYAVSYGLSVMVVGTSSTSKMR